MQHAIRARIGRGCRRQVALAMLAVLMLASGGVRAKDSPVSREYQIKAAFLYNFSKFISWPPDRFRGAEAPIIIGVLGHPGLVAELERITRDRAVNGRGIIVREVASSGEMTGLHLLFVTAAETDRLDAGRAELQRGSVLTVGETPGFARDDGVIGFVVEDDKIRFEINVASAERAQLQISAHLQKLAKTIYRGL